MHAYTRNDLGCCGQFHVRSHAFESRSGFYSQALTCWALLLSSAVGARSIMSLTRLGLIDLLLIRNMISWIPLLSSSLQGLLSFSCVCFVLLSREISLCAFYSSINLEIFALFISQQNWSFLSSISQAKLFTRLSVVYSQTKLLPTCQAFEI